MRAVLWATAALFAVPVAAQDHSGHAGPAHHAAPVKPTPEGAEQHDGHREADQQPRGQAVQTSDPKSHAEMGHPQVDHGSMDQSAMDHGAMDHGAMDHSRMDHGSETAAPPSSGPPPRALEGPRHAADVIYGTAAMASSRAENEAMDRMTVGTVMLERLEARVGDGQDLYLWDAQAWYGGDSDKLWLKSEGEGVFGGEVESAEVQALWSHAIGPFFDLQAGVRYDIEPDSRGHAVLGVQGLAPYMVELDAAAFLSDQGDLTARIEAEYDQRITQRLILQPRAEVSFSAQDIPARGIAAGITSVEAGLRLRYEFAREFAPYIGVGYEAKLGGTADLARAAGEDSERVSLLLGVRAWF